MSVMFKVLGLHNQVLYGVLLSTMILTGCQPDPKEGVAVHKAADDSLEVAGVDESMPEELNENNVKAVSDVEVKSDRVDLERRTSAIAKKEPVATKGVEVSIEDDKVKPEKLFDYANPVEYAEGYTQTIYPKSGSHPTFAGYPVVSFDTLYFDEWVGCCPRATNDLLLANVPAGKKQQLETYANKNECEISDISSEDLKNGYVDEDRDIPAADSYIQLTCPMSYGEQE